MTQAPVLSTGDDVGPGPPVLPYASVGRRAAAVILDGVVLMAGGWLFAFVAGETNGVNFSIYGAKAVLLFALFGAYCIALETWIGATLGKLVVGIRVVDDNGQRIDLPSSTIRNVLRIVDSQIGYLVGAIVAWRSPTLQRVGDRVAGTLSCSLLRRLDGWRRPPSSRAGSFMPLRNGASPSERSQRSQPRRDDYVGSG